MRGLHYGQELVSTKGSDTFAQTTRSDKLLRHPGQYAVPAMELSLSFCERVMAIYH